MLSLLCKTVTNPICIAGGAIATLVTLISPVFAQITPDETLGNERSQVNRNVQVRGALGDRITGGATRGSNLFHSFQEFNVNAGQRVYFGHPNGIENILSRVTGRDVSDIMGTLGVDGAANLFLLNPNGIIFGPNARLDVSGSFLASGGDRFTFSDGSEFSATNPQAPPLLSVNVPLGLQYGTHHPGSIANQGHLITGQDLTLTGNQLNLQGQLQAGRDLNLLADQTLQIRDSALQPFVAASGGTMLLQGNQLIDIFALNHPFSGLFSGGDMLLRSPHPVSGDARYFSNGSFRVEELTGAAGDLFSLYDPVILTLGDVFYGDYTGPSLHILAGGNVTLGNIVITDIDAIGNSINPLTFPNLANVPVSDGTIQPINGSVQATLDVRAGIDWTQVPGGFPGLQDGGLIPPPVLPPIITGSDISITSITNRQLPNSLVFLSNRFFPNAALPPGDITILAADVDGNSISAYGGSVTVDAQSDIFIASGIDTSILTGTGGNIRLLSGGEINTLGERLTAGSGSGNGGSITLTAIGDIFTNTMRSFVSQFGVGNGGDITVTSRNGSINVLGFLESAAAEDGFGNGGNITLDALERVMVFNTVPGADGVIPLISSFVSRGGTGDGGNILVRSRAGAIDLSSGRVSSATEVGAGGRINLEALGNIELILVESFSNGTEDAGDITISSNADIQLEPGGLVSSRTNGAGRGGNLSVNARSLFLPGAFITANTFGTGNAGDITLRLRDQLIMTDASQIRGLIERGAGSPTTRGATIDIQARSLSLTGGSQVVSGLFREGFDAAGTLIPGGQGIGGDIRVTATDSVLLSGTSSNGFSSGLLSLIERGTVGNAGNVTVNMPTGLFRVEDGAAIASSTLGTGNGGSITVNVGTFEAVNGGKIAALSRVLDPSRASGNAGNITVTATNQMTIAGVESGFLDRRNTINRYLFTPLDPNDPNSQTPFQQGETELDVLGGLIEDSSGLYANTDGLGTAGSITLTAPVINLTDTAFIRSDTAGNANAGSINITTQGLTVSGGAEVLALTSGGAGVAGDITVQPLDPTAFSFVTLTGVAPVATGGFFADGSPGGFSSGLFAASERDVLGGRQATGAGGNITVTTSNLTIANGATLSARTRTTAPGGSIVVNVEDLNVLEGGQLLSTAFGSGRAGNVTVNATGNVVISGQDETYSDRFAAVENLFLTSGVDPNQASQVARSVIDPTEAASGLQAQSFAVDGTGSGNISIRANSLFLADRANLNTSTSSRGDAGAVEIRTARSIIVDDANVFSTVEPGGVANSGTISIRSRSLTLQNGGQLQTLVRGAILDDNGAVLTPGGQGNAGEIDIRVRNDITLDGVAFRDETGQVEGFPSFITSQVQEGGSGRGGNIDLTSRQGSLVVSNGGRITANVFGEGRAGNIRIDVAEDVVMSGLVEAEPEPFVNQIGSLFGVNATQGRGGRVEMQARSLLMSDSSQISSSTFGVGNAGNINIRVDDSIAMLTSSTIRAAVESGSQGNGGDIQINGRSLLLDGGSQILASVFRPLGGEEGGIGNGGNINIAMTDDMIASGAGISVFDGNTFFSGVLASTEVDATGRAGNITVTANNLNLTDGAFINAQTENNSPAGNIGLNLRGTFLLEDNGRVFVEGRGQGLPGNLSVTANSIIFNRGGRLLASTQAGGNANISIRVNGDINMFGIPTTPLPDNLDSCSTCNEISAQAFNNGNGGNIRIDAPGNFVIGRLPENSDVVANAFEGTGGRVSVRAAGVFGFRRFEDRRTPDSDLTASSELGIDGTTDLETDDQFEAELPVDRIDPATLITDRCAVDAGLTADEALGSFTVTGRGGLPPNPLELIDGETVFTRLAVEGEQEMGRAGDGEVDVPSITSVTSSATPIIEAQGWVVNADGQVMLVAQNPVNAPDLLQPSNCTTRHTIESTQAVGLNTVN